MIKETNIRKITKTEKYQRIVCDLCGTMIADYIIDDLDGRKINENELYAEENKPVIGMITYEVDYGDSGTTEGECYDICEKCYNEKVKPLLKKELGLLPRKVKFDY